MKKLMNNIRKTFKNKIFGIGLFIIGLLSNILLEDGTFLLLSIFMTLALFFAKENVFEMR